MVKKLRVPKPFLENKKKSIINHPTPFDLRSNIFTKNNKVVLIIELIVIFTYVLYLIYTQGVTKIIYSKDDGTKYPYHDLNHAIISSVRICNKLDHTRHDGYFHSLPFCNDINTTHYSIGWCDILHDNIPENYIYDCINFLKVNLLINITHNGKTHKTLLEIRDIDSNIARFTSKLENNEVKIYKLRRSKFDLSYIPYISYNEEKPKYTEYYLKTYYNTAFKSFIIIIILLNCLLIGFNRAQALDS
jgi:hypothetical protein